MTHDRSSRARSWAIVWALLLLLPPSVVQGQGADDATAATDDVVLQCRVVDRLPAAEAEVEEGGFAFVYQSVAGSLADGRSCTVYRLRNLPGRPPTPVRWRAGGEVLVDAARLARCADANACDWLEVARYFEGEVEAGETQLSFGLNADSFHHQDRGLVAVTQPSLGAAQASVGSEVLARLTLADESTLVLHVVVKSRFVRGPDGLELVYDVVSDDPTALDGSRVRFVWEAFAGAPQPLARLLDRDDGMPFAIPDDGAWEAPGSVGASDTDLAGAPRLVHEQGAVAVVVPVERFAYLADLTLYVVDTSDPATPLLSIAMPAFVPGDGR